MNDQCYEWTPGDGPRPCRATETPLLAADSWLVENGAVRALARHRRRFAASCAEAVGLRPAIVDRFWDAVCASLPTQGRWFPRVELTSRSPAGRLAWRLRSAPATTAGIRAWVFAGNDPRQHPRRKGPDLPALGELRRRAQAMGAQDAVLTTGEGTLLEGATSSLMWWDAGTLCIPAAELPILPGVTASLIRERATSMGVPVRPVRCTAAALDGKEVWLVNALHGIRAVTSLVQSSAQPCPARLAAPWRRWLAGIATAIAPASSATAGRHGCHGVSPSHTGITPSP